MERTDEQWVELGRAYLSTHGYSETAFELYRGVVRRFLSFLRRRGTLITAAGSSQIELFLTVARRRYRRRLGHDPAGGWRTHYTAPIHLLFRLACGSWPPPEPPPATEHERFSRGLRDGYRAWLLDVRGLSLLTFTKNWGTAGPFLKWLGDHASAAGLRRLTACDLDAFLAWRMASLRRATRAGVCQGLRSFLQYLHAGGHLERDLAACVTSPSRYWNEPIPCAFTTEQVEMVLAAARSDRSAAGRRDYAILLLLATYGLRAGEIVRLRLEHLDWRHERFAVTHSKTGHGSILPLLREPGEALLDYLRQARPRSRERVVFLRLQPPFTPFPRGSSLSTVVRRRLQRCGLKLPGRHGCHAFRYTRAISLLRAAVPLPAISSLLGHRAATSTDVYLKLADKDLREVGLELPAEVAR